MKTATPAVASTLRRRARKTVLSTWDPQTLAKSSSQRQTTGTCPARVPMRRAVSSEILAPATVSTLLFPARHRMFSSSMTVSTIIFSSGMVQLKISYASGLYNHSLRDYCFLVQMLVYEPHTRTAVIRRSFHVPDSAHGAQYIHFKTNMNTPTLVPPSASCRLILNSLQSLPPTPTPPLHFSDAHAFHPGAPYRCTRYSLPCD